MTRITFIMIYFITANAFEIKQKNFLQEEVEGSVLSLFDLYDKRSEIDPDCPLLLRQKHVGFLKKNLIHLPAGFQVIISILFVNLHNVIVFLFIFAFFGFSA